MNGLIRQWSGSEAEHEFGEAADHCSGSGFGEACVLAGLVGVADAVSSGEVRGLPGGGRVADGDACAWWCAESGDGLVDEVRAGLKQGGVAAGAGGDQLDTVG